MKRLVIAMTTIAAALTAQAQIAYPREFKVFFSDKITTSHAATLRYEDDLLVLDEKTQISAVAAKLSGNVLDLRQLDPDKKYEYAVVSTVIYTDTPGKFRLGMGADWWFDCYCNGKYMGGTPASGNFFWPPTVSNFVFELPLRAGRNELTIFTRSGQGGWSLAIGEPPEDAEPSPAKELPVKPEVVFKPYITNPTPTSVTISCIVRGRQPLELEYRKKGNKVWKKLQILRGGQLLDEGPVMRFDLEALQPDTVYEYRILKRIGEELRQAQAGSTMTFKTFSKKAQDFSFWLMSDTHADNYNKLKIVKNLLETRKDLQKADMFIHLGDFASTHDDIESSIFSSFLQAIPAHQAIVPLRGNHEFDGAQSGRYLKYLGSKENKSYQAFKLGNIFFIVLDTGHHLPKDSTNSFQRYTGLNELDTLLAEQTAWLENVVKCDDFRNADYRLVFGHVAPHSQNDGFNHMIPRLRKMTGKLFRGAPAAYPVNLWFAGHTHKYQVSPAAKNWQFPVMVLGGGAKKSVEGAAVLVKVKNNKIYLESIDSDGKTRDKFELLPSPVPQLQKL